MKRLWHIIKLTLYFLYNFSGIRHLWESIICPIDKDTKKWKPSTFVLWTFGLYIALFGIASQRYENRVDQIEIRISSIFAQLSTPFYKNAFSTIDDVQRMSCPLKPNIKKPISVYQSLLKDTTYIESVDLLKAIVKNWKDSLKYVNLSKVDLSNTNLSNADLRNTKLWFANLSGADLSGADLSGANLSDADLRNADLRNAELTSANLSGAYLRNADLGSADLRGADLGGADLGGAFLDSTDFINTLYLNKDQLSYSYYIDYPPINLPNGIDPPQQYEESTDTILWECL
jgi:pentapeptide repeat protein